MTAAACRVEGCTQDEGRGPVSLVGLCWTHFERIHERTAGDFAELVKELEHIETTGKLRAWKWEGTARGAQARLV